MLDFNTEDCFLSPVLNPQSFLFFVKSIYFSIQDDEGPQP